MALVQCLSTIYDEAQLISADGRAAQPHIPWHELDALKSLINQNTLDFDAIWHATRKQITPLAQIPTPTT